MGRGESRVLVDKTLGGEWKIMRAGVYLMTVFGEPKRMNTNSKSKNRRIFFGGGGKGCVLRFRSNYRDAA